MNVCVYMYLQVFSFLSIFVWGANMYWVLIDTAYFIQWQARRRAKFDNF